VIDTLLSQPLTISAAKIIGSVLLLAFVLWAVSRLSKIANLDPEVGRKLVHISLGLYCLTFPWIFSAPWEVATMCALATGVFLLARGTMRASLGGGLHGVERVSYGEILFAASVALLFWLKDGHYILTAQARPSVGPVLYILPILILTLCDAASALVGSRYGRRVFRVEEGSKSIEGVVVFAVTAWLVSLMVFLLFTDIGRGEVILLAFITAVFGALLEAASWRGLDNLFIPLGLYFLLSNLLHLGVLGLAGNAAIFFVALLALLYMTGKSGADRHFVAIGFTLFFCIDIFSGFLSLITPALAVGAYLACVRLLEVKRPAHDDLNLLLVVFGIALACFLVSNLAQMDAIYMFNLAFAALMAGIVARFSGNLLLVIGAMVGAWLAMSVRVLWVEGQSDAAWLFAGLGAGAILVVAAAGWMMRRRDAGRPWIILGGLSLALGVATLPVTP
jgi:phytol kinase